MSYSNSRQLRSILLGIAVLALPIFTVAQQSQLSADTLDRIDQELAAAKQLVSDLDSEAESCMSSEADSVECQNFSTLINGDFLPEYLGLCHSLQDWRALLAEETAADGVNPQQGPEILQRLMDVEFNCGEEALTRRTQYVLVAWNKIRSPNYRSDPLATTLPNQYEAEALNFSLRNSLIDGYDNQRERLKLETQRLWQQLELENLRQQSRRPIDFGTISQ